MKKEIHTSTKKEIHISIKIVLVLAGLIILNAIASSIFARFDLTQDKRYTLSEASKNTLVPVKSPINITIFLKGDLPAEYKRLADETEQLLAEFAAYNDNVEYTFVDPIEENAVDFLNENDMKPRYITEEAANKVSREVVYPWAIAIYDKKLVKIQLYKNNIANSDEEKIASSVQHLEYAFADAFSKLTIKQRQRVAILRGHNELDDIFIYSFQKALVEYYNLGSFDITAFPDDPEKTLKNLERFDLLVVPKPTKKFSDKEKYILDQYTMRGGKSLWLIETAQAEMDSIREKGKTLAFPRDLGLQDFFFSYGIRINPKLVNDMQCAAIGMEFGEGNNAQYLPVQWRYNPLTQTDLKHPITNNTNLVRFEFANQIDVLKSGPKKTVLLKSSPQSKLIGIPKEISLNIIENEPAPETYQGKGGQNLAVLLEGTFESVYANRVKPFELSGAKNQGESKMLVIADGDVIKNQVSRGQPQELGYDIITKRQYGNKEFLVNSVNYLLDNNGLINIRSKELKLAFLDSQKVTDEKSYWQWINIGFPLAILVIFGVVFTYMRKRKFAK
ncbi:gliding motility-associated ABC transporter substrate-binding protein GldG [uncultured Kordia sp.]|uniref:gliding motility-associated ABC transporter substrate-binding protein GldG n=1 Tax=uncultured Kordia sp. TaxID=507699 RepID=UPI002603F316|nr:gliding motility-associated ABC transporter substrate-binding protein GldG [uncultured Kordia sp.]